MTPIPTAIADQLAQLSAGVEQMRTGMLDREAVTQLCAELLATERANPVAAGAGYRPGDYAPDGRVLEGTFQERMMQVHTRDAGRVAPMVRQSADTVREFQERADGVLILDAIMTEQRGREYDVKQSTFYRQEFAPLLRAMDTQTAGEGLEWVPTMMSNELIRRVNLALRVANLFRMIPMPSNPFKLPAVGVVRRRTGIHAEQTADTGQTKFKVITAGTRGITLTAVKLAARMLVSKEEEEDAIVAVLPWMMEQLVEYLAADWEDTLINGDSVGSHMDSDTTDSDDPRKLANGLRALTQAAQKTDAGNDALTVADLRTNRRKMGKYGIDPSKLAHIVSIGNYVDLLSDPSVITIDKLGPNATILSGQLATVDGAPVVVSEYIRQDLNATGVYDASVMDRSTAITAHTGGFLQGERRGVTVKINETSYDESDQDLLTASMRRAFEPLYPVATEGIVAQAYNTDG